MLKDFELLHLARASRGKEIVSTIDMIAVGIKRSAFLRKNCHLVDGRVKLRSSREVNPCSTLREI